MNVHTATTDGIERLRTLYSILAGIPDKHFDLTLWRREPGSLLDAQGNVCGTTACAVGWACEYPNFQKQGLNYSFGGGPCFEHHRGFDAVETFFDLRESESAYLFLESAAINCYTGLFEGAPGTENGETQRLTVMRRIRTVLLHKGAITQERFEELAAEEELLKAQVRPELNAEVPA